MAVFLWFWFFFWTDEITNEDFPRGPKNENPGTQLLEICECQRPLSATWETLKGFSKVPTRHCQPNVESLCVRDKSVGIVQIKESNLLGLVPSWCQPMRTEVINHGGFYWIDYSLAMENGQVLDMQLSSQHSKIRDVNARFWVTTKHTIQALLDFETPLAIYASFANPCDELAIGFPNQSDNE